MDRLFGFILLLELGSSPLFVFVAVFYAQRRVGDSIKHVKTNVKTHMLLERQTVNKTLLTISYGSVPSRPVMQTFLLRHTSTILRSCEAWET